MPPDKPVAERLAEQHREDAEPKICSYWDAMGIQCGTLPVDEAGPRPDHPAPQQRAVQPAQPGVAARPLSLQRLCHSQGLLASLANKDDFLPLGEPEILVLDKHHQLNSKLNSRSWRPSCGRKGPRLPTGSGGKGSRDCPVPTAALLRCYTPPSVPFSSYARHSPTFPSPPRH